MWPFSKRKEVTLEAIFAYLNETRTGRDIVTYLTDPSQNIEIQRKPLKGASGFAYTHKNLIEIDSRLSLHDQALVLAHEATHIAQHNDPDFKLGKASLRIRSSNLMYALVENNDLLDGEAEADNTVNLILAERAELGLKNENSSLYSPMDEAPRKIIGGVAKTLYTIRNKAFLDTVSDQGSKEFLIDSARNRAVYGYEKFVKQTGIFEALTLRLNYLKDHVVSGVKGQNSSLHKASRGLSADNPSELYIKCLQNTDALKRSNWVDKSDLDKIAAKLFYLEGGFPKTPRDHIDAKEMKTDYAKSLDGVHPNDLLKRFDKALVSYQDKVASNLSNSPSDLFKLEPHQAKYLVPIFEKMNSESLTRLIDSQAYRDNLDSQHRHAFIDKAFGVLVKRDEIRNSVHLLNRNTNDAVSIAECVKNCIRDKESRYDKPYNLAQLIAAGKISTLADHGIAINRVLRGFSVEQLQETQHYLNKVEQQYKSDFSNNVHLNTCNALFMVEHCIKEKTYDASKQGTPKVVPLNDDFFNIVFVSGQRIHGV